MFINPEEKKKERDWYFAYLSYILGIMSSKYFHFIFWFCVYNDGMDMHGNISCANIAQYPKTDVIKRYLVFSIALIKMGPHKNKQQLRCWSRSQVRFLAPPVQSKCPLQTLCCWYVYIINVIVSALQWLLMMSSLHLVWQLLHQCVHGWIRHALSTRLSLSGSLSYVSIELL